MAISLEHGSFSATFSSVALSVQRAGLQPIRRRYDVTANNASLFYTRRIQPEAGVFALAGGDPSTNYTFALQADAGDFSATLSGELQRHLRLPVASTGFLLSTGSADLPKGFIAFASSVAFSATSSSSDLFHAAHLQAAPGGFTAAEGSETHLQRHIILHIAALVLQAALPAVGINNNRDGTRPSGMAPKPPAQEHGGSEPSYPSFIRPQYVRFNSITKARDLGLVNNIYTKFVGRIGSQVGVSTIFFKVTTTGPADLRISKNAINRYTDGYLSVGILDAGRKPIQKTSTGFAFQNEVANTPESEFENYLPGGTYYFTLSSSQWQALDFDIDIQVIRFRELSGSTELRFNPSARLPFAKMRGSAELTAPVSALLPDDSLVIKLLGAAELDSAASGTLTIMEGVSLLKMSPRGRLLTNHKLNGAITMSAQPVGELTSEPPYGYGY